VTGRWEIDQFCPWEDGDNESRRIRRENGGSTGRGRRRDRKAEGEAVGCQRSDRGEKLAPHLENARDTRDAAAKKFRQLEDSGESSWQSLKDEVEHLWKTVKQSVNYFKSRP
jgi:hypothetical protein